MNRNALLFTVFLCLATQNTFSQNSRIVNSSMVSPYFDEWMSRNDFTFINQTISGPVRWYSSIFDSNNQRVLGTDTPLFYDAFDTISINDTLSSEDLFPYNRIYLDSPFADYFDTNFYLPSGNYKFVLCFLDTNTSTIDTFSCNFFIDSLIGPTLLKPSDNIDVYYPLVNDLKFNFLHRDFNYTVHYKYIMREVPDSFNFALNNLEDIFLDTSISDIISFNINGDDTSLSFNEYNISIPLDTNKLYTWTIREFLDSQYSVPILANYGFSTPFLLILSNRTSSNLEVSGRSAISCNEMGSGAGFENGTLDGWVCGTGNKIYYEGNSPFKKANGIIINNTGAAISGRHTIVTTGFDSKVSAIPKVPVGGGNYALKLGNEYVGNQSENAMFTFTVNSSNSRIKLRYAVILQDINHDPPDQPIFRIRVFRKRGVLRTRYHNLIDPILRIADRNDPFFSTIEDPNSQGTLIAYSTWNCVELDLRKFEGETVTLEVATSDCAQGGHFGYAYVDFCGTPNPDPNLTINSTFCEGQTVIADGSTSTNMHSWLFTVEECLNSSGTRFGATEYISKWFYGYNVQSDFNITDFLASKGVKLECNKFYRIKLGGRSNCSDWVEDVKVIQIICPGANLAGPDRCLISGSNTVQLGSNPISGYSYSWSPSTCLFSSTVANPVFDKTLCPPQNYPYKLTLTVTYLGCTGTDDVYIYDNPPIITNVSTVSSTSCGHIFSANFSGGQSSDLIWTYTDKGITYTFKGNPVTFPLPKDDVTVTVSLTNPCGTVTSTFPMYKRTNDNKFGDLPILIAPNAMDPHHPDTRSLWIWEVGIPKDASPAYDILGYHLRIYNSYGEKVFDKFEEKDNNYDWTNGEIMWNGTTSYGYKAISGVYVWTLFLWNCAHKTEEVTVMEYQCTGQTRRRYKFDRKKIIKIEYDCVQYQWVPVTNDKHDITVIEHSY